MKAFSWMKTGFLQLFASYFNQIVSRSLVFLSLDRIKEVLAGTNFCPVCCPVGTIAISRSNKPQLCPNESQNTLRMEIKLLLWATSSSAALPLRIKVPPCCSVPNYNLWNYIPLFVICHYLTEISCNIFVNVLQEDLGCYWTVLHLPLFQTMQAQLLSNYPLHPHSLSLSPFS